MWNLLFQPLRTLYISTTTMPLATERGRVIIYLEGGPSHKVTWLFNHVVFRNNVTDCNHYISNTTVSMFTKLGRVWTYREGLLIITSRGIARLFDKLKRYFHFHNAYGHQTWQMIHNVTWSFNHAVLRDHIRNVISPLPQCLKPPDLAVWWLRVRGFHPYSRTTIIKSHGPLSCDQREVTWQIGKNSQFHKIHDH